MRSTATTSLDNQRDTDAPWCRSGPEFVYCVRMSRRRLRRKSARAQRHAKPSPAPVAARRDPLVLAEDWFRAEPAPIEDSTAGRGSRGTRGRATRVHARPGRTSARHRPLDVRAPRAPVRRDPRNAVGHEADPGRRARASPGRVATSGATTTKAEANRPTAGGRARRRRTDPQGARRRHEPQTDRGGPQRRRDANGPRGRALVAVHRALRPRPLSSVAALVVRSAASVDWLAMARTRSRELGPAMRPVAVPDDLDSSMPKASGRIELPLHIRWSGRPSPTTSTTERIEPASTSRSCEREPRATSGSTSTPSNCSSCGTSSCFLLPFGRRGPRGSLASATSSRADCGPSTVGDSVPL